MDQSTAIGGIASVLALAWFMASVLALAWLTMLLVWKMITPQYAFIHCPVNVPLFGSSLHLERVPYKLTKQLLGWAEEANHVCKLMFSFKPFIFASKAEYSKVVLSSQKLMRKSILYNFFHDWLGTGLLTSYGKKWKTRRRLITPSFHFSILSRFAEVFEKHALNLVERIGASADKKETVDVQKVVSLATLEAMCEASMGVKTKEDEGASGYIKGVGALNRYLQVRQTKPWFWPDFVFRNTSCGRSFYKTLNHVRDYTTAVINKRISIRSEADMKKTSALKDEGVGNEKQKLCFIDTLLDSYQAGEIDIDGIREEVDTFIFEGHDTTATAISFCLYLLGRHPEYLKTLQYEIDKTEGKDVLEKVRDMQFLDFCLKETLRLYPSVPFIGRQLEENVVIEGQTFYKNTDITVNIIGLHRNETYWEDPMKFNPYRFDEKFSEKRNPFSNVPFSAGPRNCIGQRFAVLEAKTYLYHVLKNFNVKSLQEIDDIELCAEIILKSNNGVLINFERRTKE